MPSLRPYPSYKDTDLPWLAQIPAHWDVKPLKHAVSLNSEVLPETTDPNYEIQYLDIGNVDEIEGIGNIQEFRFENAPSRARRRVRSGDTIISTVRTYLKAVAYFENPPENQIVSTGFAVLRPKHNIYPKFLSWLIQSKPFVEKVVVHSVGVGYPAINPADLASLKVWLPPLPEQQTIAVYLDRQTAKIDALIAKKQRLLDLLAEQRASLISQAVTKGLNRNVTTKDSGMTWLGQVPSHWDVKRIAYLFRERDERNRAELPLLNVSIHTGVTIREFSDEHVEQMADDFSVYKVAYKDDIAFNKMRMWQGAVGIVPTDGLVSPDYVVATKIANIDTNYYGYLFKTAAFSAETARYSHGIVWDRLRLYWEEFKSIYVPVPPLEQQHQIVDYIIQKIDSLEKLANKVETAIKRLQEYRAALISSVVTGKVQVKDEGGGMTS